MTVEGLGLDRWIEGQRLGLASHAYSMTPGCYLEQANVLALIRSCLAEAPGRHGLSLRTYLRQLSPSVLSLLLRASRMRQGLDDVASEVQSTLEWMTVEGNPAPFVKAQIWTYHVLHGPTSTQQLVRLGRSLFGDAWKKLAGDPQFRDGLDRAVETLRSPVSRTQERLEAVAQVRSAIGGWSLESWIRIESLLIGSQMGWPLFVSPLGGGNDAWMGFSLPVAVDVDFDGLAPQAPQSPSGILNLEAWGTTLDHCAKVGRQLWQSKRGNHGDFRHVVARARVDFDFSLAQAIGHDLHALGYSAPVTGGSADVYFAQMVLARLLGRPLPGGSAITGGIGKRMKRPEDQQLLLNYRFQPAEGVAEKLDYAFSTWNYERIVLPQESHGEVESALELARIRSTTHAPQNAEVIFAHNLQGVADAVQGGDWRQYRYVRCPDLIWAVHSEHHHGRSGLLPESHPEVVEVLQCLARNQENAILEMPGTRPIALASALWHLHLRRHTLLQRVPPMLSWAFVRLLEGEQDSLFWGLLWNLAGSSAASYRQFLRSVTRSRVAEQVADILNCFEPSPEVPSERAPDIMVLIGTRPIEQQPKECRNPHSRPFMVWPVLQEIQERNLLHGPFDEAYRPWVGRTRLILIPEERREGLEPRAIPRDLDPLHERALRILSVLEWGFSLRVATQMLQDAEGFEAMVIRRDVLDSLIRQDLLRVVAGRYHFPEDVLARLRHEAEHVGAAELARRHLRAGSALASFASRSEHPATALDVAFSPEIVNEADRHLRLAKHYANETGQRRLGADAGAVLGQLMGFVRLPHWGVVDSLLSSRQLRLEAHEMAEELLGYEREVGVAPHPQHLAFAARAAADLVAQFGTSADLTQGTAELLDLADRYYQEALENCDAYESEADFNRLRVLSHYVTFLDTFRPEAVEEINRCIAEVHRLDELGVDRRAVVGDCFEMIGDRQVDHAAAYQSYRAGSRASRYLPLWMKALGTAVLMKKPTHIKRLEEALDKGQRRSPSQPVRPTIVNRRQRGIVYILAKTSPSIGRRALAPHVRERWRAALDHIDRTWGTDPTVRRGLLDARRRLDDGRG